MDNSLIHIPVTTFLKALCKVVLADSIVFLAKFGWSVYYIVLGINGKLHEENKPKDDDSNPYPLLSFILGCSLLFGVGLRYLSNFLMYQDAAKSLVTATYSTRHFFCTRCCASSRFWLVIVILNLGLCVIVATALGDLSLGTGIIFLIWELAILLVLSILKIFIYRYFLTTANTQNLINSRRSSSVVSSP